MRREALVEKAAPVVTELRTDWTVSDKRLVAAVVDAILPQVSTVEERTAVRGWLPTLGEEFGEVCRALTLEGDRRRLRAELIDTAAVALMWIDSIDRDAEGS